MNSTGEPSFRITLGVLWLVFFGVRIFYQKKVRTAHDYVLVNAKREKLFFWLFGAGYLLLPLFAMTPWFTFANFPFPAWLRCLEAS